MKQLQLSPPLLIITMGYPGSGTTYFARQFAEQYNLPRVSEDRVRFELFEQPLFNKDESEIIDRLTHLMLEELMSTKQTIIYEAQNLTERERKTIYELAYQKKYHTLTVWLQTDIETSKSRAAQRDRRNPDNKYAFPIQDSVFERLRSTLQRPTEKENALVISGKHAFKSQCVTILRKIAAMYGANGPTDNKQSLGAKKPKFLQGNITAGRRIIQ